MTQTHNKFKVFVGPVAGDGTLGDLGRSVEAFVAEAGVSPKSIGAEYLERAGQLLISLGYRDDEPAVPVRLHAVRVGVIPAGGTPEMGQMEAAMGQAAAAERDIICHELYITDSDELFMIFMTAVSAAS